QHRPGGARRTPPRRPARGVRRTDSLRPTAERPAPATTTRRTGPWPTPRAGRDGLGGGRADAAAAVDRRLDGEYDARSGARQGATGDVTATGGGGLTAEQRARFERDGFLIYGPLWTAGELASLRTKPELPLLRGRDHPGRV